MGESRIDSARSAARAAKRTIVVASVMACAGAFVLVRHGTAPAQAGGGATPLAAPRSYVRQLRQANRTDSSIQPGTLAPAPPQTAPPVTSSVS